MTKFLSNKLFIVSLVISLVGFFIPFLNFLVLLFITVTIPLSLYKNESLHNFFSLKKHSKIYTFLILACSVFFGYGIFASAYNFSMLNNFQNPNNNESVQGVSETLTSGKEIVDTQDLPPVSSIKEEVAVESSSSSQSSSYVEVKPVETAKESSSSKPSSVSKNSKSSIPKKNTASSTPKQASSCDPSYPTICIPINSPDLDCPQIPHKNFKVVQPDKHRFDSNKDGIGCEKN